MHFSAGYVFETAYQRSYRGYVGKMAAMFSIAAVTLSNGYDSGPLHFLMDFTLGSRFLFSQVTVFHLWLYLNHFYNWVEYRIYRTNLRYIRSQKRIQRKTGYTDIAQL